MTEIRENARPRRRLLATYSYDDRGRRISLTRGNGTVTSYELRHGLAARASSSRI